jgi:hypothetical protein
MYHNSITKVVQEMVLEGRKPAKIVAEEIGKPYSTLLRELNPFDSGAKVGVETLLEIMRSTGSIDALEYLAREFGYDLVPSSGMRNTAAPFSMQDRTAA